jgi:hypothetical protein
MSSLIDVSVSCIVLSCLAGWSASGWTGSPEPSLAFMYARSQLYCNVCVLQLTKYSQECCSNVKGQFVLGAPYVLSWSKH